MVKVEVKHGLSDSQRAVLKTQLLDVGVRVVTLTRGGDETLIGYVYTFSGNNPIGVQLHLQDPSLSLTPQQLASFKFAIRKGRFVLETRGKKR